MGRMRVEWGAAALASMLCAAAPGLGDPAAPDRPVPAHSVVGRLEEHVVADSTIGSRRLWVLLPPDYDATERYPVVYAQDGQDLFDAATAAGGEEWALDELLAARPPGIPDILVVGVEAAADARLDDSPPGSTDGARGDAYVRFLADTVKPFVDRKYPTRSGPEDALALGCGAGAVIALYAAWTRPDSFGGAIALELPDLDSQSSSWASRRPAGPRLHLWIEQAGGDSAYRPSATALLDALRAGAEVQYVLGTGRTSRVELAAAGLRALFTR